MYNILHFIWYNVKCISGTEFYHTHIHVWSKRFAKWPSWQGLDPCLLLMERGTNFTNNKSFTKLSPFSYSAVVCKHAVSLFIIQMDQWMLCMNKFLPKDCSQTGCLGERSIAHLIVCSLRFVIFVTWYCFCSLIALPNIYNHFCLCERCHLTSSSDLGTSRAKCIAWAEALNL